MRRLTESLSMTTQQPSYSESTPMALLEPVTIYDSKGQPHPVPQPYSVDMQVISLDASSPSSPHGMAATAAEAALTIPPGPTPPNPNPPEPTDPSLRSSPSKTLLSSFSSLRVDTMTQNTTSSTEPSTNVEGENAPSLTTLETAFEQVQSTSQAQSSSSSSLTSTPASTIPLDTVSPGLKQLIARCPSCMNLLPTTQDETSVRTYTDDFGKAYLVCGPCPRCGCSPWPVMQQGVTT